MRRTPKSAFLGAILLTFACGDRQNAATPTSNDSAPDATVISQGTFEGVNGHEASGIAQVMVAQSGELVVRLESLNVESGSGMQVIGKASGEALYTAALKSTTGDQNYFTGLSGTKTWTSIHVSSSAEAPPNNDYGVATLTAVQPAD